MRWVRVSVQGISRWRPRIWAARGLLRLNDDTMTRFTSIGIKKRAFLPSAAEESAALAQADPSHATPTTATDDAAPPPPKRLKSHRGTRGKKDKRIKAPKPVTQGSEAVEGQAAGAGGGQEVATEYVGQFDDERAPDGRKTMAGLKGPKPGETATEHQARMAKRETQKERRRKGSSLLRGSHPLSRYI